MPICATVALGQDAGGPPSEASDREQCSETDVATGTLCIDPPPLLAPEPETAAQGAGEGAVATSLDSSPNDGALPASVAPAALEDARPYWHSNLFLRVLKDQPFLVRRWWPSELGRRAFTLPLLAGIAQAAGSSGDPDGIDQRLEASARSAGTHGNRRSARLFSTLGEAPAGALLIGTAWLFGKARHDSRLSGTASLAAESAIDAGIWVTVLKAATARTRPSSGGTGTFFQYRPQAGQQNGSFPSGHAMGAFAVASVFAHQYPEKKWVPWVAYGAASLVASSRLVLGRHYPSDVIVGGLLGNSIGRMVVFRAHGLEDGPSRGTLTPIFDPAHKTFGVGCEKRW